MKGIRVLSLLDKETNSKIGKKSAPADITLYSYKQGDIAVEIIEPTLYPEKVQPLVFGLCLADFVVFRPDTSKKEFGEILAALIISGKPGAFVGDRSSVEPYIKGSALEKWETLEDDPIAIRERMVSVQNNWKDGKVKIVVDQVFSLKSIGVVVLGAISRGTIRVHDDLLIFPPKMAVSVKSLQLHDANVPEISDGSRVGANIKGAEAESIHRGFILGEDILSGKSISAELYCPHFIKDGLKKDAKVFAYLGLHFCEATLGDDLGAGQRKKIGITCAEEAAYENGDLIFIVDPGRKPRIIAAGRIQ